MKGLYSTTCTWHTWQWIMKNRRLSSFNQRSVGPNLLDYEKKNQIYINKTNTRMCGGQQIKRNFTLQSSVICQTAPNNHFFSFLFIFHSRKNRKIFVTQSQLILSCHINIAHLIYTLEYSEPRPAFANFCVFVCSSPIISSKATWYFFVSITKSKYVYRTLFSKQKTSNNEYLSHYYVMECDW